MEVPAGRSVPPVGTSYHLIEVPEVVVRLEITGELPEQNVCVILPVGAAGVEFTTATTSSLVVLSHPIKDV